MQVEFVDRRRWNTRVELSDAILEYLEIFHNRRRRHSVLGMLTRVEFPRLRYYPSLEFAPHPAVPERTPPISNTHEISPHLIR